MKFLAVLLLFLCVGFNLAENNRIVRIPLERMETGLEKLLRRGADLNLIEGIYDMHRRMAKPSKLLMQNGKPTPSNDTLPLFKYFDTQYYGLVNIGKPGKTFKMVMDTAWAFSWVPSIECPLTSIACGLLRSFFILAMKFLAVLLLFLCVGFNLAENNRIVRIPLERMETGLEKLLRRGADLNLIEGIYDMHRRMAKPSKLLMQNGKPTPSNDTLPLFKYFDTQYYGLVNIGKPGKTFKMVMDTAWAFSWVPSIECPLTSIACARHDRYDHTKSSTYKVDGEAFNISNKYIGYISTDVFLVGQMNATGQKFAELHQIPWIFALFEADGTIGLGFKELSPNVTPFFYNFYTQNKIAPIFSFYVNRDPTTKRGGSIFFGGIDFKHNKTEFTTVDVTSPYFWQFKMDKVTLVISKKSQVEYCKAGCTAVADTSANTIVGPINEIRDINRLIGAERIFFSNRFMIPCINEFKGPKVKFTIANQEFQILARDYIQKISYSGITVCLSAFQPAEPTYAKNTWILGGAFLYQYYTAYDVEKRQIMIAEAA